MRIAAYSPGTNSHRISEVLARNADRSGTSGMIQAVTGLSQSSVGPALRDMANRGHIRQIERGVWQLTADHPMVRGDEPQQIGHTAPRPEDISELYPIPYRMALVQAAAAGDTERLDAVIDRMVQHGLCAPRASASALRGLGVA